jgi:tRNA 2-thiouridine synthesizing protein A
MSSPVVDARGLECPVPVVLTKKALRKLASGDVLTVYCTDPMAEIDIPVLLFQTGDIIDSISKADNIITITIRKC